MVEDAYVQKHFQEGDMNVLMPPPPPCPFNIGPLEANVLSVESVRKVRNLPNMSGD